MQAAGIHRRGIQAFAGEDGGGFGNYIINIPGIIIVGVAFGAEWRRETLKDDRDPRFDGTITYTNPMNGAITSDVLGASPSGDNSGDRDVGSLYAEFAIPLVSPSMGVPLVRALDLQVAGPLPPLYPRRGPRGPLC